MESSLNPIYTFEVTNLEIFPSKEDSDILAFAVATFNDSLIVRGIKIVQGKKGVYVAFPLQKNSSGTFYPLVYPANSDAKKLISNRILATYVVNHCMEECETRN